MLGNNEWTFELERECCLTGGCLGTGKDLHKLALPTHLNEPLTDLQRRVEAFESCHLLDQASHSTRSPLQHPGLCTIWVLQCDPMQLLISKYKHIKSKYLNAFFALENTYLLCDIT